MSRDKADVYKICGFAFFILQTFLMTHHSSIHALEIYNYDAPTQRIQNLAWVIALPFSLAKKIEVNQNIQFSQNLPKDTLATIIPTVTSQGIELKIRVRPEEKDNYTLFFEVKRFLSRFDTFSDIFHWIEVETNAKLGSVIAKWHLREAEIVLRFESTQADLVREDTAKLNADLKSAISKRKALWNKQRSKFNELETKTATKLDDYVRTNNRKGVRKLLDAYLPWPLMDPVEKSAWMSWLDVMENPDPKQTTILFRGIDDAAKIFNDQGKPYFFSTLLSENQGNYNRRLRSYAVQRERFSIDDRPGKISKIASSLFFAMNGHAQDPNASSWLSLTSSLLDANNFGEKRLAAFKIDRRLATANFTSEYDEFERLAPLIIFPDQVIVDTDREPDLLHGGSVDIDLFRGRVEKRIGRSLRQDETSPKEDAYKKEAAKTLLDLINATAKAKIVLPEHLPPCKVL
jgi:hypothetical protein